MDELVKAVFPLTLGPDGHEPAYAAFPRDGMELSESQVLGSRLVLLLPAGQRAAQESHAFPLIVHEVRVPSPSPLVLASKPNEYDAPAASEPPDKVTRRPVTVGTAFQ